MDERIEKALELAWNYAQIDGEYHKMWVIDQMVRALCGSEEEYEKWVEVNEMKETNIIDNNERYEDWCFDCKLRDNCKHDAVCKDGEMWLPKDFDEDISE